MVLDIPVAALRRLAAARYEFYRDKFDRNGSEACADLMRAWRNRQIALDLCVNETLPFTLEDIDEWVLATTWTGGSTQD